MLRNKIFNIFGEAHVQGIQLLPRRDTVQKGKAQSRKKFADVINLSLSAGFALGLMAKLHKNECLSEIVTNTCAPRNTTSYPNLIHHSPQCITPCPTYDPVGLRDSRYTSESAPLNFSVCRARSKAATSTLKHSSRSGSRCTECLRRLKAALWKEHWHCSRRYVETYFSTEHCLRCAQRIITTIKWHAFAGDSSLKVSFKARIHALKLQLQRELYHLWDLPDDLPARAPHIKARSSVSRLESGFSHMKV